MTEPKADTKQLTPQEEPEMRQTIFDAIKKGSTRVIEIGETVICDWCGENWTDRAGSGGILFGSKACCPSCAPGVEEKAKFFNEEDQIKKRCPRGVDFKKWVLGSFFNLGNSNFSIGSRILCWDNIVQ